MPSFPISWESLSELNQCQLRPCRGAARGPTDTAGFNIVGRFPFMCGIGG